MTMIFQSQSASQPPSQYGGQYYNMGYGYPAAYPSYVPQQQYMPQGYGYGNGGYQMQGWVQIILWSSVLDNRCGQSDGSVNQLYCSTAANCFIKKNTFTIGHMSRKLKWVFLIFNFFLKLVLCLSILSVWCAY